ncbi:MAG: exopolysaccharide biosynthesis protein [Leptolyngbya sp. SIO4C1]|nr:exopolysaccharide biosynthesis protein [Leptolyngbya sp. SIO4C1]
MHLRFSRDLHTLLETLAHRPLTLADILAETSERGFGLVIGLLVLPFLFPMPPGLTTVLGGGCLVLSVQMLLGRQTPWLPRQLAQFRFPKRLAEQLLSQLQRVSRRLERWVRPRWVRLAEDARAARLNGACISWLTLLLMLPIPFTNPIPTAVILLLVIAMLEADGLLMCAGYGLTLAVTGGFVYPIYLIGQQLVPMVLGQG